MIFHDIVQNSDEWFELRKGKVTTSKLGLIMANYGKAFGEPAKKYAFKLAKEQVTGVLSQDFNYSNIHMENGHIYEPVANECYQYETFYTVTNGGFCQSKKFENVGGSPDGLVTDFKGGIEIKSVIDWTHRNNIKRNSFDPSYKWQILGNIWLCELDWLDFISYGYSYTDNKKLFIHRVSKDDYTEDLIKIEKRLSDFLELIELEKKYL